MAAKRPLQSPARPPLSEAEIKAAAYVGSPEHKVQRWWGGLPAAQVGSDGLAHRPKKQQTTICPLTTEAERETATEWVKAALRAGQFHFCEGDKRFPKHLWYGCPTGQLWFGFCINGIAGQYKGWPIDEDERREIFG